MCYQHTTRPLLGVELLQLTRIIILLFTVLLRSFTWLAPALFPACLRLRLITQKTFTVDQPNDCNFAGGYPALPDKFSYRFRMIPGQTCRLVDGQPIAAIGFVHKVIHRADYTLAGHKIPAALRG